MPQPPRRYLDDTPGAPPPALAPNGPPVYVLPQNPAETTTPTAGPNFWGGCLPAAVVLAAVLGTAALGAVAYVVHRAVADVTAALGPVPGVVSPPVTPANRPTPAPKPDPAPAPAPRADDPSPPPANEPPLVRAFRAYRQGQLAAFRKLADDVRSGRVADKAAVLKALADSAQDFEVALDLACEQNADPKGTISNPAALADLFLQLSKVTP